MLELDNNIDIYATGIEASCGLQIRNGEGAPSVSVAIVYIVIYIPVMKTLPFIDLKL